MSLDAHHGVGSAGRLWQGGTAGHLWRFVIGVVVVAGAYYATEQHAATDSALNLQLYVVFAALTTQCLAAIVTERRRAARELTETRGRIAEAGERERHRLEGELHDSAQSRLFALQINLSLVQEGVGDTAPDLVDRLGGLMEDADALADDLRRIAHGGGPRILTADGLAAALAAEGARSTIPVTIAADKLERGSPEMELTVYLCCMESIQNAAKHAGREASVTLRLRQEGDRLAFTVHDTGRGFDPQRTKPGAGLSSLRARAEAVGGHVDIAAAPGRGTTVAGDVPWPARVTARPTPSQRHQRAHADPRV